MAHISTNSLGLQLAISKAKLAKSEPFLQSTPFTPAIYPMHRLVSYQEFTVHCEDYTNDTGASLSVYMDGRFMERQGSVIPRFRGRIRGVQTSAVSVRPFRFSDVPLASGRSTIIYCTTYIYLIPTFRQRGRNIWHRELRYTRSNRAPDSQSTTDGLRPGYACYENSTRSFSYTSKTNPTHGPALRIVSIVLFNYTLSRRRH